LLFSSAHLPNVLLLLRQRCVVAGDGLGTGLGITIKYVRRTASGAAGNGLGTTIKYLRRKTTAPRATARAPRSSTCSKQLPRESAW
jgi:hypothetical protein